MGDNRPYIVFKKTSTLVVYAKALILWCIFDTLRRVYKQSVTMSKDSMSKAYEAKGVEDRIYKSWIESGYFTPENLPNLDKRTEAFSIVLPPPNVTGTLHMGHAAMLAIEDSMVRFARMRGKRTLWLPGTDHAAIATESKVEKILIESEGKTRHDLGREAFLERVGQFAQDSHDTIVNQTKKMGASIDWSREAYTLDDERNFAVRTAFKKMYEDGLIYRGHRVVNWDPKGQTTVSDDEVEHKESMATMYTFRYSKDFPIAISTTRPETKVGDVAVAVHPEDPRYVEFIGQNFEIPFAGTKLNIHVVGDTDVDPKFGTGALGVTPAHSTIDSEIAGRHDLPMVQVIGKDGKMTESAGELVAGKTTFEARKVIVEWLREENLLENEEEIAQNLSIAQRSGGVIEPLPMDQWFINVNKSFALRQSDRNPIEGFEDGEEVTLKTLMQSVVKSEQIEILPNRFEKTYFHWIDNLRDWNISRQIWFGHRIPVWYKGEEIYVGLEKPEGDGWIQDEDTLDTWFSSGLWTFSTLGWPNEDAEDFRMYHPTTVMETGYDILFFWVARMILMSTYLVGEIPFKTVYLHGLVRDENGKKMSKSLGNVLNPLDMIAEYGADATRLSLLIGTSAGNDSKISTEKVAGFRNFTNKLWNISRFVFMTVDDVQSIEKLEPKTTADEWILYRLDETIKEVTELFEKHSHSQAGEILREFTWNEFADWYIEIAKVQKNSGEEGTDEVLLYVLEAILKMWHPMMPFVTEEIYSEFDNGMIMIADWPVIVGNYDVKSVNDIKLFIDVVTAIRNIRAEYQIAYDKDMSVIIVGANELKEMSPVVKRFVRAENIDFADNVEVSDDMATAVLDGVQVYIPLEGMIDIEAERAKLEKELAEVKPFSISLEKKLQNEGYLANAPKAVVEKDQARLAEVKERVQKIESELLRLN